MIFKQHHTDVEEVRKRFEHLLGPQWNALARYCHSVAGEREAARDLMSETLLVAWQHFAELRDEAAFRPYLFKIAVRINYEAARKRKRQTPLTDELARELETTQLADDGEAAFRLLATAELYAALDTLPDKQREAIVLFEISGLSLKEVQQVQGGSLSGVKSRIVRGREELARKLGVRNPNSQPEQHDNGTSTNGKASDSSIASVNLTRAYALSGKVTL